eukprot:Rmarinus@m.9151
MDEGGMYAQLAALKSAEKTLLDAVNTAAKALDSLADLDPDCEEDRTCFVEVSKAYNEMLLDVQTILHAEIAKLPESMMIGQRGAVDEGEDDRKRSAMYERRKNVLYDRRRILLLQHQIANLRAPLRNALQQSNDENDGN